MKTILIVFGLIVIGFVLKSCIQRGDRNLHEEKRPSSNQKPTEKMVNDKLVIIKNVKLEELKSVIKQFCNMYNQQNFRVLPQLTVCSDSEFVITFPYDIDFEAFCFLINYLYYPNGITYKPVILAWTTTKQDDSWMKNDIKNKKVMLYIPSEDKEYDNVYLTTEDNIGFKMGFAMGEESRPLNRPNKIYQKPDLDITAGKEVIDFE